MREEYRLSYQFASVGLLSLFLGLVGSGGTPCLAQEPSAMDVYKRSGKFGEAWGDGIPIVIDAVAMERGKSRYMAYCAVCHGMNGVSVGGSAIGNLLDPRTRQLPDGELFHVITNGRNTMNGFGPALTESDRWKIVAYVRALQNSRSEKSGVASIAMTKEIEAIKKKQPPAPVK